MGLTTETLKRTSKTKAHSTAFEVLEELGQFHELPRLVLEWRGMMKLKGTYIDALPQLVNPETGRVHTCFNQAVAATGRLSSSDPNLQNIPIRTELGREIRRAFVAEAGHVLISADYSQIELRVLAHLSGDPALLEAFTQNIDIHDRTALKVFGADSGLSVHELRRRAKIINYALLYGKQAFTLAKDIGVPREEAQAFIDAYFAGFPSVRAFIDGLLEEARQTGTVKTMFGRRRLVPDLNNRNGQVRAAAERAAVNMPIQGSAADILKKAMIDVHAALPSIAGGRARMILTVHDELLFEAPSEAADETAAAVRQLMESAVALKVPVTVDVGIGENWKEAKSDWKSGNREFGNLAQISKFPISKLPDLLEVLPLGGHASRRPAAIARGEPAGAIRNDRLRHQLVEIGAQRDAAVAAERGADPAGGRRGPGAIEIAGGAGRGREPVARRRGRRVAAQLLLHAGDDARILERALRGRQRLRLAIERGRPPVERALVRVGRERRRRLHHRIQQLGGGAEALFEIQELRRARSAARSARADRAPADRPREDRRARRRARARRATGGSARAGPGP